MNKKEINHILRILLVGIFFFSLIPCQRSAFAQMIQGNDLILSFEISHPVILQGVEFFPSDPFHLEFIVNQGDMSADFEEESYRLIKYFLAGVTIPDKDKWVNLSPYENDRIISEDFEITDMGRDLLEQDYILKQFTSYLMYPENELGSDFWEKIYARVQKQYGTTDIPVNTFNKVWIVPDVARVYEEGTRAFVLESHLKVMLEQDYLALKNQSVNLKPEDDCPDRLLVLEIIKEMIVPEIEKEVNHGKNFFKLRQVYNSLILSSWFKRKIKESIFSDVYVEKSRISGIDLEDEGIKDEIYARYLEAFKTGMYNYIKEEYDPNSHEVIPRKYFSGGTEFENIDPILNVSSDPADRVEIAWDNAMAVNVQLNGEYGTENSAASKGIKALGTAIQRMYDEKPDLYQEFVQFLSEEAGIEPKSPEDSFQIAQNLFNYITYAEHLSVSRDTAKKVIKSNQLRSFTVNIGGKKDVNLLSPKSVELIDRKRREVLDDAQNAYFLKYGKKVELKSVADLEAWLLRKDFLEKFPLIKQDLFDSMKDLWSYQVKVTDIGFNTRFKYIPQAEITRLEQVVVSRFKEKPFVSFLKKYGYWDDNFDLEKLTFDMAFDLIERIKKDCLKAGDIAEKKGYSKDVLSQKIRDDEIDYIDLNFFGKWPDYFIPVNGTETMDTLVQKNLEAGKKFLEERCGIKVDSLKNVKDLIAKHAVTHDQFVEMLGMESVPGFKDFDSTVALRMNDVYKPLSYMPRQEAERIQTEENEKFKALLQQVHELSSIEDISTKKQLMRHLKESWISSDSFLERSDHKVQKSLMNSISSGKYKAVTADLLGFGRKRVFFLPQSNNFFFMEQRNEVVTLFMGAYYKKLFNNIDGINEEGIDFFSEVLSRYFDVEETDFSLFDWEMSPELRRSLEAFLMDDLVYKLANRLNLENAGDFRLIIDRFSAILNSVDKKYSNVNTSKQTKIKLAVFKDFLEKIIRVFQLSHATAYKAGNDPDLTKSMSFVSAHLLQTDSVLVLDEENGENSRFDLLAASLWLNNDFGSNRVLIVVRDNKQFSLWDDVVKSKFGGKISLYPMKTGEGRDAHEEIVEVLRKNKRYVAISQEDLIANPDLVTKIYADYVIWDESGEGANEVFSENNKAVLEKIKPKHRAVLLNPQSLKRSYAENKNMILWMSKHYSALLSDILSHDDFDAHYENYSFLFEYLLASQVSDGNDIGQERMDDLYYQNLLVHANSMFFSSEYQLTYSQKGMLESLDEKEKKGWLQFRKKLNSLERSPEAFEAAFAIQERNKERFFSRRNERALLSLFQDSNNGYAFDLLFNSFKGLVFSRVNARINTNPKLGRHKEEFIGAAMDKLIYGIYKFDAVGHPDIKMSTYLFQAIDRVLNLVTTEWNDTTLRLPSYMQTKKKYLLKVRSAIVKETGTVPFEYKEYVEYSRKHNDDFESVISFDTFLLLTDILTRSQVSLNDTVNLKNDKGGSGVKNESIIGEHDLLEPSGILSTHDQYDQKDFLLKFFSQVASLKKIETSRNKIRDLKILAYLFGYDIEKSQTLHTKLTLEQVGEIYGISSQRSRQVGVRYREDMALILKRMDLSPEEIALFLSPLNRNGERNKKDEKEDTEDFAVAANIDRNLGGIDFTIDATTIESQNDFHKIQFDEFIENFDSLTGFYPVIVEMHAVPSSQVYLGF